MSILIPGKMPTRCWDCPCAYETEGVHHNYCQAVGYDTQLPDEGRPDWCPLIELPPHGRLIDAAVLLKSILSIVSQRSYDPKNVTINANTLFQLVDSLPTVIPPEGGADNE